MTVDVQEQAQTATEYFMSEAFVKECIASIREDIIENRRDVCTVPADLCAFTPTAQDLPAIRAAFNQVRVVCPEVNHVRLKLALNLKKCIVFDTKPDTLRRRLSTNFST